MKKDYQKPMLISEEFIPNEYVAACYNFKALFHCHYGENNTNNHGEPCATTYVDINGIHEALLLFLSVHPAVTKLEG